MVVEFLQPRVMRETNSHQHPASVMQIDQREALDDPRPIIGVMAHSYPPAVSSPSPMHGDQLGQDNNKGKKR